MKNKKNTQVRQLAAPVIYRYHVVYMYQKDSDRSGWSIGTLQLKRTRPLNTSEEINETVEYIKSFNSHKGTLILTNWILL